MEEITEKKTVKLRNLHTFTQVIAGKESTWPIIIHTPSYLNELSFGGCFCNNLIITNIEQCFPVLSFFFYFFLVHGLFFILTTKNPRVLCWPTHLPFVAPAVTCCAFWLRKCGDLYIHKALGLAGCFKPCPHAGGPWSHHSPGAGFWCHLQVKRCMQLGEGYTDWIESNNSGFKLICDPLPDHTAHSELYNDIYVVNPIITV